MSWQLDGFFSLVDAHTSLVSLVGRPRGMVNCDWRMVLS
jgi:hypothetical protein